VNGAPARILCVNAGSTSLKLHLVSGENVRGLGSPDELDRPPDAVGHRVVHGGARFVEPAVIDDAVVGEIERVSELAPLHNVPALEGIARLRAELPDVEQVAVFDTAFHHTLSDAAATYAVPARWRRELGVRRYGFHGLSVRWAVRRAAELAPGAARLVVCHLGGGCSLTAVAGGRSVDTSMGFSPLDGVPMATRPGGLDPGILLHVLRAGASADELDRALNRESGLLGLSETSARVEELERAAGGDERARLALDVFTFRIACVAGAMAVAAGGVDALVFTGGVGERSARVRGEVCARLAHLGVVLDEAANAGAVPDADVAASGSAVRILVVGAREELVIAADVAAALAPG
jgi:acetate kinase